MARIGKSAREKTITGAGKRRLYTAALRRARQSGFAPPAWLGEIGGAETLEIWSRNVPELVRLNLMSEADGDVFGRYCTHFAEWIRATADIAKNGTTLFNKMDRSEGLMPRLNPSFRARQINESHLLEIEDRFGGSPLARFRLIAQQAAHPGAFGDLFNTREPDQPAPGDAAAQPSASPIGMLRQQLN